MDFPAEQAVKVCGTITIIAGLAKMILDPIWLRVTTKTPPKPILDHDAAQKARDALTGKI